MEIREITQYHEHAPFTGYGVWIVIEEKDHKARLLHPVYLTELFIKEYDYAKVCGNSLWPTNDASNTTFNYRRFVQRFKERVGIFAKKGKAFPVQSVAKALAYFDDIPVVKALEVISKLLAKSEQDPRLSDKSSREYRIVEKVDIGLVRGRPKAILDVLRENGAANIYQITSLVEGRMKTKLNVGRVVTYYVNKLTSQGALEIVDRRRKGGKRTVEHTRVYAPGVKPTVVEEPKARARNRPAIEKQRAKVRSDASRKFRLADGFDPSKIQGQRSVVVKALQRLSTSSLNKALFTLDEITDMAKEEGLEAKAPLVNCVNYHLNHLVKDNYVVRVSDRLNETITV
jgi:hypothetical protein